MLAYDTISDTNRRDSSIRALRRLYCYDRNSARGDMAIGTEASTGMTLVDEYTELEAAAADCERDFWVRWVRQSRESIAVFERGIESNRRKIAELIKQWHITEAEIKGDG